MSKLFSSFPGSLFCHGNALRSSFGEMKEGIRVYKTGEVVSGEGALEQAPSVGGWRGRISKLFGAGKHSVLAAALVLGLGSTVACDGPSEEDPMEDMGGENKGTTGETGGETDTGETESDGTSTDTGSEDTTDTSSTDSGTDASSTDSGTDTEMEPDAVIDMDTFSISGCNPLPPNNDFDSDYECSKTVNPKPEGTFNAENVVECKVLDQFNNVVSTCNKLEGSVESWSFIFDPQGRDGKNDLKICARAEWETDDSPENWSGQVEIGSYFVY